MLDAELPASKSIRLRPVWARYLRRLEGFPLDIPTDDERLDAICVLRALTSTEQTPTGPVTLDTRFAPTGLFVEAQRILDEADGLPPR